MSLPSVKILVVDDHLPTLQQWQASLQKQEIEVLTAGHGLTAYELAQTHQPDFILSDIDMPEIDGFELLKLLKKSPKTAQIPVIVCSGTTDDMSKFLASTLGATAYLKKPLNMSALQDIVEQHYFSTSLSA